MGFFFYSKVLCKLLLIFFSKLSVSFVVIEIFSRFFRLIGIIYVILIGYVEMYSILIWFYKKRLF